MEGLENPKMGINKNEYMEVGIFVLKYRLIKYFLVIVNYCS